MKLQRYISWGGFLLISASLTAQPWTMVGSSGASNKVRAMCVYGTDLYAAGNFSAIGGVSASYIAKWNGSTWASLPFSVDDIVFGLGVISGELYAAGRFSHAGTQPVKGVAKWNGSSWQGLVAGMGVGDAEALTSYNGEIYVAGEFDDDFMTVPIEPNAIARWDGSQWQPLGTNALYGRVNSLCVYQNELYVAGDFADADTVANTQNIAKWNGTSWEPLSIGINGTVHSMHVHNALLYIGGEFSNAGGVSASNIVAWDGTNFSPVGGGTTDRVSAITTYNNRLCIGGDFEIAGGNACNTVALWDGTNWSQAGDGLVGWAYALQEYNGEMYAGGVIEDPTGATTNAVNIAKWSGGLTAGQASTAAQQETTIHVFPNPSSQTVFISPSFTEAYDIRLYDTAGKMLQQTNNMRYLSSLDVSGLAQGVYRIHIINDRQQESFPLLIHRN